MNAGETFQQAMDIDFYNKKDKIFIIYLDEITVFSKSDEEHVAHLLRMSRKCTKFSISLNPKKSFFSMKEGKLSRHIIYQEGIKIDPKRVRQFIKLNSLKIWWRFSPFWER